MSELKKQIEKALTGFLKDAPRAAAGRLLNVLGYESDKTADIEPNTWAGFKEFFPVEEKAFNAEAARVGDWRSIDIVFQLTDEELKKRNDLFSAGKVDNRVIESYLFLAVSLSGQSYSRTDLVRITREINKLTPMPAMLFFRYGDSLTIAAIDRRLHKRDEGRDVLEKVTLIKDISTVKPHRAHIEILYDLALENMSGAVSFVALHNAWRKALDGSELNKRFYREIADWYFWAVKEVQFPLPPTNKLAADPTNNSIAMIRLLTRLIFVWFLKEKGLVPDLLFDEKRLKDILAGNDSTYYRAILQNLFFATLNAEMNCDKAGSRRFVETEEGSIHGQKNEYGVKNLYRYSKLFAIPKEEAIKLFDDIPFLNGGLFECLDKEDDSGKVVYVDGFTRNAKLQPVVPDYLFFSDYRTMDLSADYGDKKRAQEKVRGIISILQDYKFTVAENTPVEEEVALDPELLGNVFENLLASYNPETGATARKLTGSFYTPRMIVNYMVDESLKAYLAQKIGAYCNTPLQEKLGALIAWNNLPNPFSPEETAIIIEAINNLKTLDPAVGSGAFPMGLLHKIVHILHKLDPDNARWKQAQLEAADRMPDPAIRHDLIAHIEDAFDPASNQADYGRKLYLIQNCIYGVDIQPIAVQIAKLRFFISLVVDQKVNDGKKNRGVLALPNLETRFVAANTLLGIDKPAMDLFALQVRPKEAELRNVRARHFDARSRAEKLKCMADDKRIRKEIAELLEQEHYPHDKAVRLSDWNPYGQNTSADFFDPEWMFGIEDGFDITIGNPPYVRQEAIKQFKPQLETHFGKFYCGTADLYTYFYKKGVQLLRPGGHLCFIAPNKFMRAGYGKNTRVLLTTEAIPKVVIDFGDLPIFDATTYPSILLVCRDVPVARLKKDAPAGRLYSGEDTFLAATFTDPSQLERIEETLSTAGFTMPVSALKVEGWNLEQPEVHALMEKLRSKGKPLGEYVQGRFYYGIKTGLNEAFVIDEATRKQLIADDPKSAELIKPWLRGRDIRKWKSEWAGLHLITIASSANKEWPWSKEKTESKARSLFEKEYPAIHRHLSGWEEGLRKRDDQGKFWWELRSCVYWEEFERPKIMYPDIAQHPKFLWDQSSSFSSNTTYFIPSQEDWLLGLLNSKLMWWFYGSITSSIRGGFVRYFSQYMEQLPIFPATDDQKAPIVERVRKILAANQPHPHPNPPLEGEGKIVDVPRLEAEIDRLVYGLYGLTEEEVALVEGR